MQKAPPTEVHGENRVPGEVAGSEDTALGNQVEPTQCAVKPPCGVAKPPWAWATCPRSTLLLSGTVPPPQSGMIQLHITPLHGAVDIARTETRCHMECYRQAGQQGRQVQLCYVKHPAVPPCPAASRCEAALAASHCETVLAANCCEILSAGVTSEHCVTVPSYDSHTVSMETEHPTPAPAIPAQPLRLRAPEISVIPRSNGVPGDPGIAAAAASLRLRRLSSP